jgi:1-acyl-sn-glycerol-3-phosphate acyltransferase
VTGRSHNPYGFWYRLAAAIAKPVLFVLVNRHWRGHEPIPAEGGFITAVNRGECVALYPEGTVTRDPQLWPMAAKTGAARIALTTGAPVIPVAQWGAHRIVPPYARGGRGDRRVRLVPRQAVHIVAGPPVDLSRHHGKDITPDVLKEATEDIMTAITALLADIRGEQPPAERHSVRRFPRQQAG